MKTFLMTFCCVLLVVAIVIGTIWAVDYFKKPADNTIDDVSEPTSLVSLSNNDIASLAVSWTDYQISVNTSSKNPSINVSCVDVEGETLYCDIMVARQQNASSKIYSEVVIDGISDFFIYTGSLDLAPLYQNGTLQYDTTYYVYARCVSSASYSFIKSFSVTEPTPEVPVPEPPTKTGYTFTGWYTDEECTQLYDKEYVTEDITLYAGWRANNYTVVFNVNGGTGTMQSISTTYDKGFALTANVFTRVGYNFVGWATTPSGDVVYADGQTVANLTAKDGSTVTLYAVWEEIKYKVDFIVDGEVYSSIEVPYGTNLADIINGNLNGMLFYLPENSDLPNEVTGDLSVPVKLTSFGNVYYQAKAFCSQQWVIYTAIALGALAVVGIVLLVVSKVKQK